jgi:hypothetical protein
MSCLCCRIVSQSSVFNWIGNNISCPKTNCPGMASNVVWTVLRIAHATLRKGPQGSFVLSSFFWVQISLVRYLVLDVRSEPCTSTNGLTRFASFLFASYRFLLARVLGVSGSPFPPIQRRPPFPLLRVRVAVEDGSRTFLSRGGIRNTMNDCKKKSKQCVSECVWLGSFNLQQVWGTRCKIAIFGLVL